MVLHMKKDIMKLRFKISPNIKEDICEQVMREIIEDEGIGDDKEKIAETRTKIYGRDDFAFKWTLDKELIKMMWAGWNHSEKWELFRKKLYSEIMNSPEFKSTDFSKCYETAAEFFKTVPANFNKYKDKVNGFLVNDLRLGNLDMPPIDTLITFHGGLWDNKTRVIVWGHKNSIGDPAYDVRYLFHEWFHAVETFNGLDGNDISHAAMELADVYLYYTILGGVGDYGDGHRHLNEIRNKIKPDFDRFISGGRGSFLNFQREMMEKFASQK